MKAPGILQIQSYDFALQTTLVCKSIMEKQREFVLSKQLLKAATSVGANIEEAQFAQSKADFISKLSIALKEANESRYWLRLMQDAGYADQVETTNLCERITHIINILVRSLKTSKQNTA